jgi:type III secretion protein L
MKAKFSTTDNSSPQIKSGVKIIKSSEYTTYLSAKNLWEETYKDKKKNEAESSRLKLESIEHGLNKGAEQAKAKMAKQILNSASSLTSQIADIEKDLSQVVLSAVQKIINDFDDEELVFEAVKKGLQPVYSSQKVSIRVNPQIIPSLSSKLEDFEHDIAFLEITSDENLTSTDCIIESDIGIVDASINSQLTAIEKAVKSKIPYTSR